MTGRIARGLTIDVVGPHSSRGAARPLPHTPSPFPAVTWNVIAPPIADRQWAALAHSPIHDRLVLGGGDTTAPSFGSQGKSQGAIAYSDDGGLTWTSAVVPNTVGRITCMHWSDFHGRFIGMAYRRLPTTPPWNYCVTSEDGVTWIAREFGTYNRYINPVQLAELADGTLLAASDSQFNTMRQRRSLDGGITWGDTAVGPLYATGQHFLYAAASNGTRAIFFDGGETVPLRLGITDDGGDSWSEAAWPARDPQAYLLSGSAVYVPEIGLWLVLSYPDADPYPTTRMVSADGLTWTHGTFPSSEYVYTAKWIRAALPFFLAPVGDPFDGSFELFASYDGAEWVASNPGIGTGWSDACYLPSRNRIVMIDGYEGRVAIGDLS